MLKLFKQDVQRWIVPQQVADPEQVTFRTTLKLLWHHAPLRAMFWLRLGAWLYHKGVPLSKSVTAWLLYYLHGLEISAGADVGGGLYIAHPKGTTIQAKRIGQNCSIIHAVTIGMRNEWTFPEIGDGVFIGAGARVLGDICVGDGAKIGANAVVIHDVPPGATVVGIPARIVGDRELA
ncbi:MAG: serine acetyltransferase [Chloroflexota bacterium]|jgi:serine O-acetyltransferase